MRARLVLLFSLLGSVWAGVASVCAAAQTVPPPLPAEAIMARVAANQDKSETERMHLVYVQHAHVVSRRGGTVMCEETTDTRVTPGANGSQRLLLKLEGRLLIKHKYVSYDKLEQQEPAKEASASKKDGAAKPEAGHKDEKDDDSVSFNLDEDGMDRDLVENLRQNLVEEKSKDGINDALFPLTTKELPQYEFQLAGSETMNGRSVYHLVFHPKDKTDFGWKGDAYIDRTDFEPVLLRTTMAKKVPLGVRALLGTNVPGLGFNIVYARQPDGVWLPVSFGTEFKIHVLFLFRRQIVIDAVNRDFEKTHVTSKILPAGTE